MDCTQVAGLSVGLCTCRNGIQGIHTGRWQLQQARGLDQLKRTNKVLQQGFPPWQTFIISRNQYQGNPKCHLKAPTPSLSVGIITKVIKNACEGSNNGCAVPMWMSSSLTQQHYARKHTRFRNATLILSYSLRMELQTQMLSCQKPTRCNGERALSTDRLCRQQLKWSALAPWHCDKSNKA
eukprot:scaffold77919_cov18-Tisochrysis_lutea.AAC.1